MDQPTDLSPTFEARTTDLLIRLLILGVFLYWSLSLLRPFLPILLWAVVLAVALFPVYRSLAIRLGGRGRLAALLVTLAALAVVLGPVAALSANLIETVHILASGLRSGTVAIPPPPAYVGDWPVVGDQVESAWRLAATNIEAAVEQLAPALMPVLERLLSFISAVGGDVLRFGLAVIVMGFLFGPGQTLVGGGRRVAGRIIATRGEQFVDLAGATIRNVSRGVVGVAVLQAILAGVVLQAADVPGAGLLAFVIFVFALIQIGPFPVILPVLVWTWTTMATGPAAILSVLLIVIGLLDNVLKPILMARGLSTPTLVILLGVIGGTLTYGLIGLFLGPIVLAVFYDLLTVWAGFKSGPSTPAPDDIAPP